MHSLVAKKVKLGRLSTYERGPRHQNHAKMNVCIVRDATSVQRQNDQKVVDCACAKTQRKWDKLLIVIE
jgi:hypothetical protein